MKEVVSMADVYVKFEDGRLQGPFEDDATATAWAYDEDGLDAKFVTVTDDELGSNPEVGYLVEVRVRVHNVRDQADADATVQEALNYFDRASSGQVAPWIALASNK